MTRGDAAARFPGTKAGYESFYLRTVQPGGGLGAWVRYTVHRRPGHPPTGSVWFTLFDATAPAPVMAKQTLPDPVAGPPDWLHVGEARIGRGAATGAIDTTRWDLRFDGEPALRHLPRGWMYRAPLPRTKALSLHPTARFHGTLAVDGRELLLDGWPGMVGHNWGARHADRWIWLHAVGFTGHGDDTWLDVVLGRIALGLWTTPWIAAGAVSLDGDRVALGGAARTRAVEVDERPDGLRLTLPGQGLQLRGTVTARRERIAGWVYADPEGSTHDVLNCSIADLDAVVSRPGGPDLTLVARGTAAYELGTREHDHGVAMAPFEDG